MTGTATDTLNVARSQLGYNGGGDCGSPVTKYGEWAGVQTQWCAIFLSWCLDQAGVASPDRYGRFSYGEDYCPAWVQAFQNAGRWSTVPVAGQLVFYSWNLDGVADHVGIVESVNGDGTITTIEGNTDDPTLPNYACGNCCRRKTRTTYYVLGYGQPGYSSGESTDSGGAIEIGDDMSAAEVADLKKYMDGLVGRIQTAVAPVVNSASSANVRQTQAIVTAGNNSVIDQMKAAATATVAAAATRTAQVLKPTTDQIAHVYRQIDVVNSELVKLQSAGGDPDLQPVIDLINALPDKVRANLAQHLAV